MKKKLTFFLTFLCYCGLFAQSYSWAYMDNTKSVGRSLTIDKNQNLYAAANYTANGKRNGVNILKFGNTSNLVWKCTIEGKYLSDYSIISDNNWNLYFTGMFRDTLVINNLTYTTSCSGCFSMVLIKLDSSGTFQWLRQSTGSDAGAYKIGTDINNNIYICGTVYGSATFDNTTITSPSVVYSFVAKYDQSGNLLWIKNPFGTSFAGWGPAFKTDPFGNSYIAGSFKSTAHFDSITITSAGDQDIYLAKLDSQGSWQWIKSAGGPYQDAVIDLELDSYNNPLITGFFGSSIINFDAIQLTNTGGDDYFLAKYNTSGNIIWASSGGGGGIQWGTGLCLDKSGNIYVALSNSYFSKFDNNGVLLGTEFKSATNYDMVSDSESCIYFTGNISSAVQFGSNVLSPSVNPQMYVAKYCSTPMFSTEYEINEPSQLMTLFPNPCSKYITVHFNSSVKNSSTLKIIDMFGRTIYSETIKEIHSGLTKNIELSNCGPGTFLIKLENENYFIQSKKIIVQ